MRAQKPVSKNKAGADLIFGSTRSMHQCYCLFCFSAGREWEFEYSSVPTRVCK
jgi:hypothetical protein